MLTDLFWKEFVRDNGRDSQVLCGTGLDHSGRSLPRGSLVQSTLPAGVPRASGIRGVAPRRPLLSVWGDGDHGPRGPASEHARCLGRVWTDTESRNNFQAAISSWSSINSNRTAEICGYAFGISPDHCMQRRGFLPVAPTPCCSCAIIPRRHLASTRTARVCLPFFYQAARRSLPGRSTDTEASRSVHVTVRSSQTRSFLKGTRGTS